MQIDYNDEGQVLQPGMRDLILDLLIYAAKELGLDEDTHMGVSIVDDPTIHQLNKTYRGIDRPTDVLSFAMEDEGEGEILLSGFEGLPRELGDIFISLDTAQAQAAEYGHSLERELGFLAVHGFLHLNGYDHMEEEDEEVMFALQDKILEGYGLER